MYQPRSQVSYRLSGRRARRNRILKTGSESKVQDSQGVVGKSPLKNNGDSNEKDDVKLKRSSTFNKSDSGAQRRGRTSFRKTSLLDIVNSLERKGSKLSPERSTNNLARSQSYSAKDKNSLASCNSQQLDPNV